MNRHYYFHVVFDEPLQVNVKLTVESDTAAIAAQSKKLSDSTDALEAAVEGQEKQQTKTFTRHYSY